MERLVMNEEKYYIYDWELEYWFEVTKEEHEEYQKLLAEMHNIMFPKKQ